MKQTLRLTLLIAVVVLSAGAAQATTLTFENFAAPGSSVPINPSFPYSEAGYTISVPAAFAAVFDSAYPSLKMPGNPTDFFGFLVAPTLTFTGGTFDLVSLLVGPTTITGKTSAVIVGTLAGGGTVTASFPDLTTATVATLNWTGLQSVRVDVTADTGLDNIVVNANAVPEVQSVTLLALGLLALGVVRRVQPGEPCSPPL